MRKLRLPALLIALALALAGCARAPSDSDEAEAFAFPEPTAESVNMFLGESLANSYSDVTLYYAASDGAGFTALRRNIMRDAGESQPEAVVKALLSRSADAPSRIAGDISLLGCEYACGTVTVNLSIDARSAQSPQELLALEASIANTLLAIDGVTGVNVLIGDQSEGFCRLPWGVQTEPIASATAAYAQLQAERDRIDQANAPSLTRQALLYFPSDSGGWLIPESRAITAAGGDFIAAMMDALAAGPSSNACATPSIPEGVALAEAPVLETLPSGEHVLSLNFTSALASYLAFSGLEVWQLTGSLCLSLCSFLPEVSAVRVMVNGSPVTVCELGDTVLTFPEGLIRRCDFSGRVGSVATLYLADASARLRPVSRAVSTRRASSPKSLLAELFRYAGASATGGLRFPALSALYPEDVLGVQVRGSLAKVNLSAGFYRACQSLSPTDEQLLVYSMVNTLCRLDAIRSVRFYVEGRAAEALAGSVYLKSALLPNPGLVASGG